MLSILIPTLPTRIDFLVLLLNHLETQIDDVGADVELIMLLDNKQKTLGEKRNRLLQMVQTKFFVFLDDDDWVADDYIKTVAGACEHHPDMDLLLYLVELSYVAGPPHGLSKTVRCEYSVDYSEGRQISPSLYRGPPAHTHVWRTDKVKDVTFPECNFAEDRGWTSKAVPLVQNVVTLDRVLYYYWFDSNRTETRG